MNVSVRTIKDIAKICNCSTSTVSRAINGESGINKKTRERILQVVEEYNFIPNSSARELKKIESNTIALLIKGMDNPFFHSALSIFEEELKKREYLVSIHSVAMDQNEVEIAAELIKEKKLKGIVFLGGCLNGYDRLKNYLNVPSVRCAGTLQMDTDQYDGVSIAIDDEKESYRMTNYLCQRGHRKIAIIKSHDIDRSISVLRERGYRQALIDNDIAYDSALVCKTDYSIQDYSIENGYITTKKLLESGKEFTAIFATSDNMAFGAYKALNEAGIKIPDECSIIGFDGIEMSKYFCPSLTTLVQPIKEMAFETIDQLVKAINEEETLSQIIFEGILAERDSVADLKK